VLVVHVLTYSRELIHDVMPETMHTWRRELENKLRTQWAAPLVAAGIDHTAAVIEGDSPAEALLNVAHREHADLLVVGANGHGGISGRVLGGLIRRVTHRARQPVVVVPPDWAAPQGCG
jgi:nucleotide-binding universal stress UspA family protein